MGCKLAAVSFVDLDCLLGITVGAAIFESKSMKIEKTKNIESYIDSDKPDHLLTKSWHGHICCFSNSFKRTNNV